MPIKLYSFVPTCVSFLLHLDPEMCIHVCLHSLCVTEQCEGHDARDRHLMLSVLSDVLSGHSKGPYLGPTVSRWTVTNTENGICLLLVFSPGNSLCWASQGS